MDNSLYSLFKELEGDLQSAPIAVTAIQPFEDKCSECQYETCCCHPKNRKEEEPEPEEVVVTYGLGSPDPINVSTLTSFSGYDCTFLASTPWPTNFPPTLFNAIQGISYMRLTTDMLNEMGIPKDSILRKNRIIFAITEAIFSGNIEYLPGECDIIMQYANEQNEAMYTRLTNCKRLLCKGRVTVNTIVEEKTSYFVAEKMEENIKGLSDEYRRYKATSPE